VKRNGSKTNHQKGRKRAEQRARFHLVLLASQQWQSLRKRNIDSAAAVFARVM
jgi:hypothetical protein